MKNIIKSKPFVHLSVLIVAVFGVLLFTLSTSAAPATRGVKFIGPAVIQNENGNGTVNLSVQQKGCNNSISAYEGQFVACRHDDHFTCQSFSTVANEDFTVGTGEVSLLPGDYSIYGVNNDDITGALTWSFDPQEFTVNSDEVIQVTGVVENPAKYCHAD